MLLNRNRRFNPKRLWLFEGDPAVDSGKGPTGETPPAEPKTPEPKADEKTASELKAANDQLKAAQKELEKFRTEEQKRLDAEKTAVEKLAERETELNKVKRENLIERVRRENGFAAKIFDSVQPAGEDADAIKEAFEAHKTALDDYVKSTGAKPGQGTGTSTGTPNGETKPDNSLPFLVRHGLVKGKAAI